MPEQHHDKEGIEGYYRNWALQCSIQIDRHDTWPAQINERLLGNTSYLRKAVDELLGHLYNIAES